MPTAHDLLKQYFGYDSFRPGQDRLVQSILSCRDTLASCRPAQANPSVIRYPRCCCPG